jgi:glycosyltransferase involved in cell wall biosynthesis
MAETASETAVWDVLSFSACSKDKSMRVLLISSLYSIAGGGAGIMAYRLAHGLSALGHRVAVISIGKNRYSPYAEEPGLRIYWFRPLNIYPFEEKDTHPLWQKIFWQFVDTYNFHSAIMLRQILEKESPDIIHIHKMRGFSGAVWPVASRLFPGRVIQTCHDYESISPDGLMRGSIGRMALHKKWPVRGYQLLRARLSVGVSIVTAPSTFSLERITNSGLFPSAQAKVIANTHGWSQDELKSIHEGTTGFLGNRVRFLFLGRLEKEKGIVELCEAFLWAVNLHLSIRLDIAGWGTLESQLREKYGKYPSINFLGVLAGRAKEEELRNASVIIVPSLVDEVFGLVAIEAFAFGKPVIASNVGGLPELVKPGETGWLVEAGDVQGLAEQIQSVAQMDPSLLAKMSRNCMEYSIEFSLEKILKEYLDAYNQLIV